MNNFFDIPLIKTENDYKVLKSQYNSSSLMKLKVKFICSVCGTETIKGYRSIVFPFKCRSCQCKESSIINNAIGKRKQTSIERYGVDNYAKTEDSKIKSKNTCQRRYGVDNYAQTEEYKDKICKTMTRLYGVDNYAKTKEYLEKSRLACIERYGVDNYAKTEDFIEKIKDTCNKKYGCDYAVLSEEIKHKIHNSHDRNILLKYNKLNCNIKDFKNGEFTIFCDICKSNFMITRALYGNRIRNKTILCTNCNKLNIMKSSAEIELINYIKSIYDGIIIENERTVLSENKELDIYLPELNMAIEYDGLFWHSELYKNNNYHLDKTYECENKGIQLIHIFEDEWLYKQDIVKSRIRSLLKINSIIYARKCNIVQISHKDASIFLNENHMQGSCHSKYRYGLLYNNELVSLMTFGRNRFNHDEYEMHRFCNKLNINVIGGASKLFKYFLDNHPDIQKIISFADRRWSTGKLYEKLNFKKVCNTPIGYFYILNGRRYNRINFQKHKISNVPIQQSEHEIMMDKNIYRIYDCGNIKYEYIR